MKAIPLLTFVLVSLSLFPSRARAASALDENPGSVVAWGENSQGQTNIPPTVTNVVGIAAGGFHNLALRNDGTVVAWGSNSDGQLSVPAGLVDGVAVSAGGYFSLCLRSNGTVVAWGRSAEGQTNIPVGLNDVVAVACGWNHALALRADGTVTGWGQNNFGQAEPPAGLANVIAIAAGETHSLALRNDGIVVGWGYKAPPSFSGVSAIAAFGYHDLGLKGTVVSWGFDDQGASIVPTNLTGVVKVAAGNFHSLALKADTTVVAWGLQAQGQTSVPTNLSRVVAISAGYWHSIALVGPAIPPFCTPHKGKASAELLNGIVVGASITDGGCGYTNAPAVVIQGGGGSGASAAAVITNGQLVAIQIISGGCCYTNPPRMIVGSPPFVPTVTISVSRVNVRQNVVLGHQYVLESSNDMAYWTPTGPPFTAESESIDSEFPVDGTRQSFRLREVP